MNGQNTEKLAEEAEKKFKRREKKRKGKMKVSGTGVKGLARIIGGKWKIN